MTTQSMTPAAPAALSALAAVALASFFVTLPAAPASAGEADVVAVDARPLDGDRWRFNVTVRHADEGWDHYADLWQVRGPDGTLLGERVLAHPHVNEQPFTRSAVIVIPSDLETVTVRARDTVHGFGGAEMEVALNRE